MHVFDYGGVDDRLFWDGVCLVLSDLCFLSLVINLLIHNISLKVLVNVVDVGGERLWKAGETESVSTVFIQSISGRCLLIWRFDCMISLFNCFT